MKKRTKRGFTLVEILVATLILGMVTLCVTLGTGSAQKIYQESLFVSESETLNDTLNMAIGDVMHFAKYEETGADGTVYFTNENYLIGEKLRFYIKDGFLYMTPDEGGITEGSELLQLLGKSGYSGLRFRDFTLSHVDGVFSGGYTIYHPVNAKLSKAVEFSFRTLC